MILTQKLVDEAIAGMIELLRLGKPYDQSLIDQVADEHEMRPEALRRYFEQRHPDGNIPGRAETPAELDARWARGLAEKCLREYERFTTVDGRELMLNGQLHTLVTEDHSRKFVIAFSHADQKEVQISYTDFARLKVEKV